MNDTLANITKTLWENADADTGCLLLPLLGFLPKWSYHHPPPTPTSLPKDGRQNLQESKNLMYLFIFFLKKERIPAVWPGLPPFLTRRRHEY